MRKKGEDATHSDGRMYRLIEWRDGENRTKPIHKRDKRRRENTNEKSRRYKNESKSPVRTESSSITSPSHRPRRRHSNAWAANPARLSIFPTLAPSTLILRCWVLRSVVESYLGVDTCEGAIKRVANRREEDHQGRAPFNTNVWGLRLGLGFQRGRERKCKGLSKGDQARGNESEQNAPSSSDCPCPRERHDQSEQRSHTVVTCSSPRMDDMARANVAPRTVEQAASRTRRRRRRRSPGGDVVVAGSLVRVDRLARYDDNDRAPEAFGERPGRHEMITQEQDQECKDVEQASTEENRVVVEVWAGSQLAVRSELQWREAVRSEPKFAALERKIHVLDSPPRQDWEVKAGSYAVETGIAGEERDSRPLGAVMDRVDPPETYGGRW
ncbi:hypothetical protein OF83DRAFT_1291958 [Amylostereum chailletii]|nr:hypothetical protein OF83DRAFT_1291958 [Amylostereum chailletii]